MDFTRTEGRATPGHSGAVRLLSGGTWTTRTEGRATPGYSGAICIMRDGVTRILPCTEYRGMIVLSGEEAN